MNSKIWKIALLGPLVAGFLTGCGSNKHQNADNRFAGIYANESYIKTYHSFFSGNLRDWGGFCNMVEHHPEAMGLQMDPKTKQVTGFDLEALQIDSDGRVNFYSEGSASSSVFGGYNQQTVSLTSTYYGRIIDDHGDVIAKDEQMSETASYESFSIEPSDSNLLSLNPSDSRGQTYYFMRTSEREIKSMTLAVYKCEAETEVTQPTAPLPDSSDYVPDGRAQN